MVWDMRCPFSQGERRKTVREREREMHRLLGGTRKPVVGGGGRGTRAVISSEGFLSNRPERNQDPEQCQRETSWHRSESGAGGGGPFGSPTLGRRGARPQPAGASLSFGGGASPTSPSRLMSKQLGVLLAVSNLRPRLTTLNHTKGEGAPPPPASLAWALKPQPD